MLIVNKIRFIKLLDISDYSSVSCEKLHPENERKNSWVDCLLEII